VVSAGYASDQFDAVIVATPATAAAPLLEFDQSEHPIRMAILTEPIRHQAGWVDIPTGPGLGIEIDRAAMARFMIG
jgi:D-galactarolactone cycloisomerase